jgi:ADP-L-glycero-D-manno-heptose 6-epimerase
MKKKFLVTGGAGLIGSNIIELLNEKNYNDILVIDHIGKTEKWKNLSRLDFTDYIEKEKFNLEYEKIIKTFKPDFLIHEGACSSTTEIDGTYLMENNFELTKNLSELCIKKEISFIYASSAATYGLGENGYSDEMDIIKLRPLNMYGYSKQLFDLYAQKKGLFKYITGLKYFNVFGFGEAHKADMRSVVLKGYEQILETGKLKLFKSYNEDYKDGEQKRDFLYVKDAAKITIIVQKKIWFVQCRSWNC